MKEIQYPKMREELISNLEGLADPDYQYRVWVKGEVEKNIVHDEFDYAIHFLYDDTKLGRNPSATIGVILKDEMEATLVSKLVAALDELFEKYGMSLTDEEYISTPEWSNVVAAAKEAKEKII